MSDEATKDDAVDPRSKNAGGNPAKLEDHLSWVGRHITVFGAANLIAVIGLGIVAYQVVLSRRDSGRSADEWRTSRRTEIAKYLWETTCPTPPSAEKYPDADLCDPVSSSRTRREALFEFIQLERGALDSRNAALAETSPVYAVARVGDRTVCRDLKRMIDLSEVRLDGIRLLSEDLSNLYLGGAFMQRASLSNVNLRGSILAGANMSQAIIWQSDLRDAQLDSASLADASLDFTKLDGASLHGADLRGTELTYVDLSGVSLRGAIYTTETCEHHVATRWPPNFDLKGRGLVELPCDAVDAGSPGRRGFLSPNRPLNLGTREQIPPDFCDTTKDVNPAADPTPAPGTASAP